MCPGKTCTQRTNVDLLWYFVGFVLYFFFLSHIHLKWQLNSKCWVPTLLQWLRHPKLQPWRRSSVAVFTRATQRPEELGDQLHTLQIPQTCSRHRQRESRQFARVTLQVSVSEIGSPRKQTGTACYCVWDSHTMGEPLIVSLSLKITVLCLKCHCQNILFLQRNFQRKELGMGP